MADSFGEHSTWLLWLLAATSLALLLMLLGAIALLTVTVRSNQSLQTRNDSLSDTLTQVVQVSSEERLSLTRKHAEERERLRTESMLQLDAMQRNITASFTEMLLAKLTALPPRSPTGRVG